VSSLTIDDGEHAWGASMRVLLVSEPSLFGEALEELLRQEPGMEVVGLETDPEQAVERIKEVAPGVVILTDGEVATQFEAELLGLVREGLPMRIVEVDLATNTLCVYCGEQQSVRDERALADAVRHICHVFTRNAQAPLPPTAAEPIA
jgi:chemotaxis response regulator CheB